MDTEAETGVTWPRVQGHWHPGKLRGRKEGPSPAASPAASGSQKFGLWNVGGSTAVSSHPMWPLVTAAPGSYHKVTENNLQREDSLLQKLSSVITTTISK